MKPSPTFKTDPLERPWRGEFPTLNDLNERSRNCIQVAQFRGLIAAGAFPDITTAMLAGVLIFSQTIERQNQLLVEATLSAPPKPILLCHDCPMMRSLPAELLHPSARGHE